MSSTVSSARLHVPSRSRSRARSESPARRTRSASPAPNTYAEVASEAVYSHFDVLQNDRYRAAGKEELAQVHDFLSSQRPKLQEEVFRLLTGNGDTAALHGRKRRLGKASGFGCSGGEKAGYGELLTLTSQEEPEVSEGKRAFLERELEELLAQASDLEEKANLVEDCDRFDVGAVVWHPVHGQATVETCPA